MTYTLFEISETLDASGGAADEAIAAPAGDSNREFDAVAMQWELSGPSTSVDIHVECRLADRLRWVDVTPPTTGASASNGGASFETIDLATVPTFRVRVVNQDATAGNTADVDLVVAAK